GFGGTGKVSGGYTMCLTPSQQAVTSFFYDFEKMSAKSWQVSPGQINQSDMRAQLVRVLESPELGSAPRLCLLLRHIVERTISGQAADLKEFSIGVDVFERPASYDPKEDAIVRVQAKRLRDRLQLYYAGIGASDPVVIDIPKGGYVATFAARESRQTI